MHWQPIVVDQPGPKDPALGSIPRLPVAHDGSGCPNARVGIGPESLTSDVHPPGRLHSMVRKLIFKALTHSLARLEDGSILVVQQPVRGHEACPAERRAVGVVEGRTSQHVDKSAPLKSLCMRTVLQGFWQVHAKTGVHLHQPHGGPCLAWHEHRRTTLHAIRVLVIPVTRM
jgi:hypothetical protein